MCSAAVAYFSTIPFRPIIPTPTGPIFAKFAGFVESRNMAATDQSQMSFSSRVT